MLEKRDAQRSRELNKAINEAWNRWKTEGIHNAIFWDFIDRERNLILKEYDFDRWDLEVAAESGDGNNKKVEAVIMVGVELFPKIAAVQQALLWYEDQLGRIEERAKALRPRNRRSRTSQRVNR